MASYKDLVDQASAPAKETTSAVEATAQKLNGVAKSIFESGPKEAVVVADAFGKRAMSVLSDAATGAKTAFDGFIGKFTPSPLTQASIKDALKTATTAVKKVNDARKQLESVSGIKLNQLGSASKGELMTAAIRTIATGGGVDAKRIMDETNQIVRISERANMGDVNSLFNTFNALAGNSAIKNIVDLQSESALFGQLLRQSTQLGVTSMINDLWSKVYGNDKRYGDNIARRSVMDSLGVVIRNGDLDTLEQIAGKVGGGEIYSNYPDAITMFLTTYTIPLGTKTTDYPALAARMVALFNLIKSDWLMTSHNETPVYRIEVFRNIGSGAKRILMSSADKGMASAITIAPSYKPAKVKALVKSFYPYALISA